VSCVPQVFEFKLEASCRDCLQEMKASTGERGTAALVLITVTSRDRRDMEWTRVGGRRETRVAGTGSFLNKNRKVTAAV